MNDGSNAHFLGLRVRWAIQRLLQPRLPDFNKAQVPAAAARIVGIFLCLPFPSRSQSSWGLDNIPGTSGEGVQEQTPSCGVFYELFLFAALPKTIRCISVVKLAVFFGKVRGLSAPPRCELIANDACSRGLVCKLAYAPPHSELIVSHAFAAGVYYAHSLTYPHAVN